MIYCWLKRSAVDDGVKDSVNRKKANAAERYLEYDIVRICRRWKKRGMKTDAVQYVVGQDLYAISWTQISNSE